MQQLICLESTQSEPLTLIETTERLNLLLQCPLSVFPAHSLLPAPMCQILGGIRSSANFSSQQLGGLRRIGWIQKYSKRGYQSRMGFLFKDHLIYASKWLSSFKVHGIIGLLDASIERSPRQRGATQNEEKTQHDTLFTFGVVVRVQLPNSTKIRRRRIIFSLPYASNYESWVSDIESNIEECNQNLKMHPHLSQSDGSALSHAFGFVRLSELLSKEGLDDELETETRQRQFSVHSVTSPVDRAGGMSETTTGSAWTINESCSSSRIFGPRSMCGKQAATEVTDCATDSKLLSREELNSCDLARNSRLHENNSIIHVCWHRQLSITTEHLLLANEVNIRLVQDSMHTQH
ncbi:hypothetical protein Ciccas_010278 [Cichlidogyrus casuarinus]|uniref:PH domain-containing protein n=1 Tax=Cichlidogyrus casuarinus TaxID=1844966 RepID=A0ABD2PUK4_9PLAT